MRVPMKSGCAPYAATERRSKRNSGLTMEDTVCTETGWREGLVPRANLHNIVPAGQTLAPEASGTADRGHSPEKYRP
jgi:hypothetical protein